MNSDRTHARRLATRDEFPVDSARINCSAITAREDQRRHVLRLLPDVACCLSLLVLQSAPDLQCRRHDVRHWEPSIGRLGFRFPVEQGSTDSLELMVWHKCALLEIHGIPGEVEDLTFPKPRSEEH